jgi:hypothetical protein
MSEDGSAVLTQAPEDMKRDYMARVYKMTHAELFAELMRVHTASSQMMADMQKKIDELEAALPNEPEDVVGDD